MGPFASVKGFPKKLHLPVGQAKIRREFTSPIAKSTSPGQSDTTVTFFAHCHFATMKYSCRLKPVLKQTTESTYVVLIKARLFVRKKKPKCGHFIMHGEKIQNISQFLALAIIFSSSFSEEL